MKLSLNHVTKPITTSSAISLPAARAADFSLLLVATIWGINMAVMKLALQEMDLFQFNAVRLSLSAFVLGICVWLEQRRGSATIAAQPPSRLKYWATILTFVLMVGGLYQMVFAIGISKTTAGNTALIMSSMPMWTAILSFIWLHERLGIAWLGLSLAFCGTVVVTLAKGIEFSSAHLWGNLIVLTAALAWAIAAVVSRPMLKYISPIRLAFYATVGTLPLHYLAVPILSTEASWSFPPGWLIACVVYSGVFSTGLAYAMWNYGVQQLGPSHASVYQNLVPLIALAAAWMMLSEQVGLLQAIGGGMILSGLYLTRRLRPKTS